MKKIISLILVSFLSFSFIIVKAEDDFDSNRDYYIEMCSKPDSQKTNEEVATCNAFMKHMASQSSALNKQLLEIESKREEISSNIKVYAEKIRGYDSQISVLRKEINSLNNEISKIGRASCRERV